jgi:DNA-binding NarL/FixJ family response regulator
MKQSAIHTSNTWQFRVALISNNPVLRRGLHVLLKESLFISKIAEVAAGSSAVEIVVREQPQVILVDLKLADTNTSELIRAMRVAAADSHILVLSALSDETLTREALAAGAEGVVLTIQPPAVLFAAIESLCGSVPRPMDSQPAQFTTGLTGGRPSSRNNEQRQLGFIESLTARERQVIQSLAKGFSNMEIADKLCISETTVRHHFTAIFGKLHVANRQQLLITAHQQGLVEFGTG